MHPNAALLATLDDRLEAGDVEGYFEAMADDVVVHVAGRSAIAGTAQGKQAVMEVFTRFNERGGNLRYDRHAVLADDDHGMLLWTVHGAREDAVFEGTETMIVHLSGGKITEAWIDFEDRYAFDEYIGPG